MYEDICRKIIDECTFRNLSKGTIKQYVYHVSCLLKWLGDKPADEITTNDIKAYVFFKRKPSIMNTITLKSPAFKREIRCGHI